MGETILKTKKKLLGIPAEYEEFNIDILMYINSVFSTLWQLGVGPENGYVVTDSTLWSDYTDNQVLVGFLTMYVYYNVRLSFDPPSNSTLHEALVNQKSEMEFRIRSMVDWGASITQE